MPKGFIMSRFAKDAHFGQIKIGGAIHRGIAKVDVHCWRPKCILHRLRYTGINLLLQGA